MNLTTITGLAASLLTALSMLPQLIVILKTKKADNISFGMLFTLMTGLALWVMYGCMKADYIIIVSNGLSLLINLILAVAAKKYKRR